MENVARPRLALSLLFVLTIACAAPAGSPRTAPAGTWSVYTDPQPPAVGARAGLFFEYVPAPGTRGPADPFGGVPPKIVATCTSCGGAPVEALAQPYPSLAPEELYDTRATAAYNVGIVLPQSGVWSIAPFGVTVTVRDLDDFEPPLIHVYRWSDAFDPGCGRREVAALVTGFVAAYNAGDAERLVTFVQSAIDFTINGTSIPATQRVRATDRETLVVAMRMRHAVSERLSVERVHVSSNKGAPEMAIYGARTANDLPAGGQRFVSKASMWCSQQQFIHWNIGVF